VKSLCWIGLPFSSRAFKSQNYFETLVGCREKRDCALWPVLVAKSANMLRSRQIMVLKRITAFFALEVEVLWSSPPFLYHLSMGFLFVKRKTIPFLDWCVVVIFSIELVLLVPVAIDLALRRLQQRKDGGGSSDGLVH
jgi:hypothetical protein